ncbi:MAG: type III pantothenate kinase [Azonexus sp.]|jgi:type III pantothenate kinase|nr:type III pantothenate kinase [Azonexus sp.]
MIICLDSGNTRIKWGVHDGVQWLVQGALAQADVNQLGGVLATASPKPERIVLANVAGPDAGDRIREQLSAWLSVLSEVRSSSRCCGVTNLYSKPESLGVDRWCALIGARSLVQGAAVVVMAGTATTIDTIDADGQFLGGVILPGFELMAGSLARGTAALPMASGEYSIHPRCTDDAIVSGLIEAQAGAIERIFSRLNSRGGDCLLSGGHAEQLAHLLVIPHRIAHNLPLEGLKQIAFEKRQ